MTKLLVPAFVAAASLVLSAQSVNRDLLHRPLGESWPSYSGDYSGRRFSSLTQVTRANVKTLTLAWTRRLAAGPGPGGPPLPGEAPVHVGGEGDVVYGGATIVKGSILAVDGVLYVTAPDNVWALDANDGHVLWRYFWRTRGGTHIGNRGAGMYGSYLFFVTPDNYLISLEAKTGKERWRKELASFQQQYFHTMAPMVIDNHVLVGSSNDLDMPGFLQSFDPETGELATPGSRPGRTSMPRFTAAGIRGCRVPTIPRRGCTSSGLAIPRRPTHRLRVATDWTISSPALSWPSTSTRARWRGTTRPRRTTRMTGIRRRRRCSSTASSTAGRASW
jgi:hypothetical protein